MILICGLAADDFRYIVPFATVPLYYVTEDDSQSLWQFKAARCDFSIVLAHDEVSADRARQCGLPVSYAIDRHEAADLVQLLPKRLARTR
jgi:hypothetical protein